MVDGCTARKLAPHSAAAARASIVLPVPGGPNSSTPLAGLQHAASWAVPTLASAPAAAQWCRAVTSASSVMQQANGRGQICGSLQAAPCQRALCKQVGMLEGQLHCFPQGCFGILHAAHLQVTGKLAAAISRSTLQGNVHGHKVANLEPGACIHRAAPDAAAQRNASCPSPRHIPSARQQQLRLASNSGCITAPRERPSQTGVEPSQQLSLRLVQLVPTSEKPSPQSSGLTTSLSSFFSNVLSQ